MKIGDRFTQFGKTYEVIGENATGLISQVVSEEAEVKKVEEAPKRRTRTPKTDEV